MLSNFRVQSSLTGTVGRAADVMMTSQTLTAQEQKQLARNLISFLSQYKHISDSYIIEFFSEGLWETLPLAWKEALHDLSAPQIADLLLDSTCTDRRYPSIWPLSLLAFRATAHTLAFPRSPHGRVVQDVGTQGPQEFQENQSQSSLLGHLFRKHVKPKKQHEISKLGTLVKQLCDLTECNNVVDVGSGQGHLTRFLSFGLGLSVTGIEADPALVAMASKFDGQLLSTLQKENQKKNMATQPFTAPGRSPYHVVGWVNPKASWEDFVKQLKKGGCESTCTSLPSKKRPWESASNPNQHADNVSVPLSPAQPCCLSHIKTDHFASSQEKGDGGWTNPVPSTDPVPLQSPPEITSELSPHTASSPKRQRKFETGAGAGHLSSKPLTMPYSSRTSNTQPRPDFLDPAEWEEQSGDPRFILTGLHACGDLSATLLRHFASCPHVQGITSVACCYMKITTHENPSPPGVLVPPGPAHAEQPRHSKVGYPMSSCVQGLPGYQLSYKAREGACHAMEDYLQRLREESELLRIHCYRATLETVIRGARPDLRRAGVQTIKKAHLLPFHEYACLGLPRVGLPADLPLDHARIDAMLRQQGRVVVYFSLALLLAPVVETLVLLDRMLFLQEKGLQSQLVPLFEPAFSPRNLVLVAVKPQDNNETQCGKALTIP
ncbi:hypothetical protein AAFF_G00426760 [Aldrovandia affinis]|uniref:Methyltransferase domain-containing protein n=1 Tax=Aldrovandia affinis TaxID=143900 RepID=A0AAD7SBR9_9TELE|nr:hypothetical protein AAFF_G00426760 [Aldrovandia affinis]